MRVELFLCVLPLAAPFVLQPVTRPHVTTRRTPRAALLVPATETGAGLLAATGVLAWVAPEANLPGFKDYDSTAAAVVRTIGAWQIVLAVALPACLRRPWKRFWAAAGTLARWPAAHLNFVRDRCWPVSLRI